MVSRRPLPIIEQAAATQIKSHLKNICMLCEEGRPADQQKGFKAERSLKLFLRSQRI